MNVSREAADDVAGAVAGVVAGCRGAVSATVPAEN